MKYLTDSLKSLIGNLGNPERDKSASVYFHENLLTDEQLIAAYNSNWIARKIVDIPAKDSLRKWRTWNHEALKLEAEEKRLNVRAKISEAMIKSRLFGGAGIYIGVDQASEEPLNIEKIKAGGIEYLTVMTRRELTAGEIEQDPRSEYYGKPKDYTINGVTGQAIIHPSRLILFNGDAKADIWLDSGINAGWGESVLKSTADTIKQAGGTFASVASLVFEANIDVVGVPDLMSSVGNKGYESDILKRFALAAMGKGINGTLILDKEETYNRKSASFAQLPEIMHAFAMYCSAAADIPATRFLAQSPNGLNSSGESDMANYHDKLQGMQTLTIEPAMALFDQCLMRSAGVPESDFTWNPLKQMTEKELSEIGKITTDSLKTLADMDVFTGEELRGLAIHKLSEIKAFPHFAEVIAETNAGLEIE